MCLECEEVIKQGLFFIGNLNINIVAMYVKATINPKLKLNKFRLTIKRGVKK